MNLYYNYRLYVIKKNLPIYDLYIFKIYLIVNLYCLSNFFEEFVTLSHILNSVLFLIKLNFLKILVLLSLVIILKFYFYKKGYVIANIVIILYLNIYITLKVVFNFIKNIHFLLILVIYYIYLDKNIFNLISYQYKFNIPYLYIINFIENFNIKCLGLYSTIEFQGNPNSHIFSKKDIILTLLSNKFNNDSEFNLSSLFVIKFFLVLNISIFIIICYL